MNADRIEVNGRVFVRHARQAVDALFTGPRTPAGLFKRDRRGGVLLSTLGGLPFAYAAPQDGGFLVSCGRVNDVGPVRYSFGLADRDALALGITGYRHEKETADAILRAAGSAR